MVEYFQNIETFENLKTLYISLGPDFLPADTSDTNYFHNEWNDDNNAMTQELALAAIALKQVIPSTCAIVWRFDRAGMPSMSSFFNDKKEVALKYLEGINSAMERFWNKGL